MSFFQKNPPQTQTNSVVTHNSLRALVWMASYRSWEEWIFLGLLSLDRTVKRKELFWPWIGVCLTSILLEFWMSLDSFSFSVLAPIPVSMCAVPMTYVKTFSSGICRNGGISQVSDIEQGINNYSKMGHLKSSAIVQMWTLYTSLYAIKDEFKHVSRQIFYMNDFTLIDTRDFKVMLKSFFSFPLLQ